MKHFSMETDLYISISVVTGSSMMPMNKISFHILMS